MTHDPSRTPLSLTSKQIVDDVLIPRHVLKLLLKLNIYLRFFLKHNIALGWLLKYNIVVEFFLKYNILTLGVPACMHFCTLAG